MTKRSFGELELAILRVLKSGERMTVKQVHTLLGEQNKYNTIMTVMLRLAEKKTLARERVGPSTMNIGCSRPNPKYRYSSNT